MKHTVAPHDGHLTRPYAVLDGSMREVGRFESRRQALRHIRKIVKSIKREGANDGRRTANDQGA